MLAKVIFVAILQFSRASIQYNFHQNVSIMLLLGVSNNLTWREMKNCVRKVTDVNFLMNYKQGDESRFGVENNFNIMVDIFISFDVRLVDEISRYNVLKSLVLTKGVKNIFLKDLKNIDVQFRPFFKKLNFSHETFLNYDLLLSLKSELDSNLFNGAKNSLCGSAAHVVSIINIFRRNPKVRMIIPHGFRFTSASHSNKSSNDTPSIVREHIATDSLIGVKDGIHEHENSISVDESNVLAGSMFWMAPKAINFKPGDLNIKDSLHRPHFVIDLLLEKYIRTIIATNQDGGQVVDIIPAPKPMILLSMDPCPEHDRHSNGSLDHDGTDNTHSCTRSRHFDLGIQSYQKRLFHSVGIEGLVLRHNFHDLLYPLSGELKMNFSMTWNLCHNKNHRALVQSAKDSEMPFMILWENVEISTENLYGWDFQSYGTAEHWTRHFNCLLPFFKLDNYIREGRGDKDLPVFAIAHISHMGRDNLNSMLNHWIGLAKVNGLNGIWFTNAIGQFHNLGSKSDLLEKPLLDSGTLASSLHLYPYIKRSYRGVANQTLTGSNADLPSEYEYDISFGLESQYWGISCCREYYLSSDDIPVNTRPFRFQSPEEFFGNVTAMISAMYRRPSSSRSHENFVFVNAWNDWKSGFALEPVGHGGRGRGNAYLAALRHALTHIPPNVPNAW